MDSMKQPFMTSLFSVSSHHPFKVPEQYEGVFPKGNLPVHQCVGYTDNALRNFFQEASQMDWYKNTIFVITADHSSASYYESSRNSLSRFAIPLLLYVPDDNAMVKWDKGIAQQIDIMPTVLNYLNYSKPYVAFGNDLLKTDKKRFVINYANQNYQYFNGDTIIHFDGQKLNAVYDFHTDSLLTSNIKEEVNASFAEDKCKAFIQQYNNRLIDDELTLN
jgi:phosphoglycerol transferase MdoB-like AlkP superfamily enzyme